MEGSSSTYKTPRSLDNLCGQADACFTTERVAAERSSEMYPNPTASELEALEISFNTRPATWFHDQ